MKRLLTNLKNFLSNMKKTPSKSSPRGGKRGCLCDNGTYSQDCCNGDLQNQGVGKTSKASNTPEPQTVINIVEVRVIN